MSCTQCGCRDNRTDTGRKNCARCTNLKRHYNITFAEYNILLESQNYRCAICRRTDNSTARTKNFCVDHCHETGRVRGLLCNSCNRAIGLLGDNINTLSNAIDYLK